MSAFAEFKRVARDLVPKAAVVLGSGLAGVASAFRESASVAFGEITGLVSPTVRGHTGRLAVGVWGETPSLLFLGRLHFYEGHPRGIVTAPIPMAANLGVQRLILTNAAGGIHPTLDPGALMVIRGHINLVGIDAWRRVPIRSALTAPYSLRLIQELCAHESEAGRELPAGVYAALTGPCYETPAEIRALAACGADAVGMSTALEAEAAAELGLEVAAISCITNKAAGFGSATLDHAEVLANAKLAEKRLEQLLSVLVDAD